MEKYSTILLLFVALQIKHLAGDFFLQNSKMIVGRERYWHMGRALHSGVHVLLTAISFALFATSPILILWIIVVEFIVHFNIDWGKARYSVEKKLTPDQPLFWYAMGTDQTLHQLTYILMVWAWLIFS
ncbi:DUF3307 domain-containing protein [Pseudopelagicola sp. nBUS_19]|uniref:DUF3307 domain-containing protein n=1 Tax=Pseudopelagicola sp. nBUS_19 TaxID=3395316 RepID=UPI003EB72F16